MDKSSRFFIHEGFATVKKSINWESFPMKLYSLGKKLGIWNPSDIDLSQDLKVWQNLPEYVRKTYLHLISLFVAGEESVDLDIAPLIVALARKGWIEEVMYLSNFIFEEAKHVEFFRRYLDAMGVNEDLSKFHRESYKKVFYEELPKSMYRLLNDDTSEAIIDAVTIYNLIVEGVLAESGYEGFLRMIEGLGNYQTGLLNGIKLIASDESRHIAFGTYLIAKVTHSNSNLYDYFLSKLNYLLQYAIGVVREITESDYVSQTMQIAGNTSKYFIDFAMKKLNQRILAIGRLRINNIGDLVNKTHFEELS